MRDAAYELAVGWLREAGAGRSTSTLTATCSAVPASRDDVWVGSHLDSVPQGGKFDGALGVVAAIEAVEQSGCGSVVAFRGEEVGLYRQPTRCAATRRCRRAFLELHIEQGPTLERAGSPLGIVTGIVGYARGETGSMVVHGPCGNDTRCPGRERRTRPCRDGEVLSIRDAALEVEGAVATVRRAGCRARRRGSVIPGRSPTLGRRPCA